MPNWYIKQKDLLNYVEINLRNEAVRTEAGAMRYYQGPIEMKSTLRDERLPTSRYFAVGMRVAQNLDQTLVDPKFARP